MWRIREGSGVVDRVTITPAPASVKDVAKLLLSLADSPYDVQATMDPGLGFVVSRELFDKFEAAWKQEARTGEPSQVVDGDESPVEETVQRKPGRPRKKQDEEE